MTFDHVIVTRFSVRFGDYPPPHDEWLRYRWAFFSDALAPAVAAQTVSDFRWLVYFDIDTPDWLREEIEEIREGLFTPVFVPSWSDRVARHTVADIATAPYLITTRIDSDDAIATRFVADIQSRFDRQESMYINLLCGLQVERTGEIYRYDEPSNPFLSYVERREDAVLPRTVFYDLRHGQSRGHADMLSVVGPPRWMQIIHGVNLANSVRGLRVRPETYEADFQFDLPFDRTIGSGRYYRQRLRSAVDLLRLWLLYPMYAREFFATRRLRRAGTQVLPQWDSVPTRTPRPSWLRRFGRPVRRALRSADAAVRLRRNR